MATTNTIDDFIREIWAPEMQELAHKNLVAKQICQNVELTDGDRYNSPYSNKPTVNTYTPNNDASGGVTPSNIDSTNEYMDIDIIKTVSFQIDNTQRNAIYYNLENFHKKESAQAMMENIDSAILAEYANAGSYIDAGDVGGSAGTSITPTTSNILDIIAQSKVKLAAQHVDMNGGLFFTIPAKYYYPVVEKYMTTVGYRVADETAINGFRNMIQGVELLQSENHTNTTVSTATTTHCLFGKKGAITYGVIAGDKMKLTTAENTQRTDGSLSINTQYILWHKYGKKTFSEGARQLVDVRIVA